MIVSIHQPQYFPYLGFFHKLARSDVFVALDTVQFLRLASKPGAGQDAARAELAHRPGGSPPSTAIAEVSISSTEPWPRDM